MFIHKAVNFGRILWSDDVKGWTHSRVRFQVVRGMRVAAYRILSHSFHYSMGAFSHRGCRVCVAYRSREKRPMIEAAILFADSMIMEADRGC